MMILIYQIDICVDFSYGLEVFDINFDMKSINHRIGWEDLQESPLHLLFKKTMVSRQESLTFPVKQPMDFGATGLAKDATTDEV